MKNILNNFSHHADRDDVLSEVHARRETQQNYPCVIERVAFLLPRTPEGLDLFTNAIATVWNACFGMKELEDNRNFMFQSEELTLNFERHSEFATLTWTTPQQLTSPNKIVKKFLTCFEQCTFLMAVRLNLFEVDESNYKKVFEGQLCGGITAKESMYVATSFETDENGFVNFQIGINKTNPISLSIAIKRILELETYRMFTLLGLPTAKRTTREINLLEQKYSELLHNIDIKNNSNEQQNVIHELQNLLIELERLSQSSVYRFEATIAYGEVLNQRLRALQFHKTGIIREFPPFIEQRVAPAVATCKSTRNRLKTLSDKIALAVNLVNTRNGEIRQKQNQDVLTSLKKTSERQYQLQRTVEGLSVIAISYYAVSLVSYTFASFISLTGLSKTQFMTIAVPITILAVWLFVQRIKKKHT